jgi:hypothetical protein
MAFLSSYFSRRFAHRYLFRWRWLLGLFGVALSLQTRAASGIVEGIQASEPEVKAAFLYNFSKLVTWPTNAFASSNAPLVIGILGKDPIGKPLDILLAGRTVGNRPLIAVRFKSGDVATNCHILFISESERRRLDFILSGLNDRPILTVGDTKGFAERGMIELVKTDGSINLSINLVEARRAGLSLSSYLTRLDRNLRPPLGTNWPTRPPPIPR